MLRKRWHNIINMTSKYRQRGEVVNFMISTLQKRCRIIFIVPRELNLLSKFDITLGRRCNFNVEVSTSLQSCLLFVRMTLPQHCVFPTRYLN